jgi:chemotaxis regulatin CheY-phosphate phosphatase CheZ
MEKLIDGFSPIAEKWKEIYKKCAKNPDSCEAALIDAGFDLENLNSIVNAMAEWLKQLPEESVDAPQRQLAEGLLRSSFETIQAPLQALHNGQYQQFTNFTRQLHQMVSALQTLTIYGTGGASEVATGMLARLGAKIGEFEQAAERLAQHIEQCKESTEWAQEAKDATETANAKAQEIHSASDDVRSILEETNELLETIRSARNQCESDAQETTSLAERSKTIDEALNQYEIQLNELIERARNDRKTIQDLLPGATSAGLASAFAARVSQLRWSKWAWSAGFVVSVIAIFYYAKEIVVLQIAKVASAAVPIWPQILERLPVLLPLIWLAWFCARQYGHVIRLQ